MVRLILIAHAETAATRRAAFPIDEGLCPAGLEAARNLDAPRPRGAVLRSPARAAAETAAAMGHAATVEPALRDLDAGRWAGQAFSAIAAAEPDDAAAFLGDPRYAGHGGESVGVLLHRVAAWLDGLHRERGRILSVTHAAVLRAAVVAALAAPPEAFFRIDVPPLSGVTLTGDGRRWILRAGALPRAADDHD